MGAPVLAQHVGPNHRLELLDERRLKCHTCSRTLVLPSPTRSTSSTSPNPIGPPRDQQCARHVGEWTHTCRPCRADALELGATTSTHGSVRLPVEKNPPPPGLLEQARAALARRRKETPVDLQPPDPEPCPECACGKHPSCDGTSWDPAIDDRCACPCAAAGHQAAS